MHQVVAWGATTPSPFIPDANPRRLAGRQGEEPRQEVSKATITPVGLTAQDDVERLTREILQRRDRGDIHDRDAMRLWTKLEIRHMTSDEADALYYRVPEEIRKSPRQGRPPKQKSGRKR